MLLHLRFDGNAFWQAPLKLFWATLLEHAGSAKGYSSNENTSHGCISTAASEPSVCRKS